MLRSLCLVVLLGGCVGNAGPRPETAADSLAVRIAEASGGLDAFTSLPTLRFDWAVVRDTQEVVRRRHLWDRAGDRYRMEWPGGVDSTYVALFQPGAFDADTPTGSVALSIAGGAPQALGGEPLAEELRGAYERYINDAYWLLAPLKMMDPGVRRALAPDSGAAVLAVSFDGVGLTPGDRYWITTDPTSGAMTRWTFQLEGDTTTGVWDWSQPESIQTPRGPLLLPTVKATPNGSRMILTQPMPVPTDASVWTDLAPRLAPGT